MRKVFMVVSLICVIAGCRKVPLNQNEFTSLLIDMHRTDGTLAVARGISYFDDDANYAYYNDIFKRYGIDQAQFDSCMHYYSAQTALFSKIYDVVIDSLNRQATAISLIMKELRARDSVDLLKVADTLFFTDSCKMLEFKIDSIVPGLYKFSTTVKFDSLDQGKNDKITAFFLAEKRRDTLSVDSVGGKKVNRRMDTDTLRIKYDTLYAREILMVNDTLSRNYNWSQYVDSTYSRLVIRYLDSDNLSRLKNRRAKAWNNSLFHPYISDETEKRLRLELKGLKEFNQRKAEEKRKAAEQRKTTRKK